MFLNNKIPGREEALRGMMGKRGGRQMEEEEGSAIQCGGPAERPREAKNMTAGRTGLKSSDIFLPFLILCIQF